MSQFEGLFRGTVGDYKEIGGSSDNDKAKTPYHTKRYRIPVTHMPLMKKTISEMEENKALQQLSLTSIPKMRNREIVTTLTRKRNKSFATIGLMMLVVNVMWSLHHIVKFAQKSRDYQNLDLPEMKIQTQIQDADNNGVCLSPERLTPWILDGSCMKKPHLSTFSSTGHHRSCGLCGDGAEYLRKLRDEVAKYEKQCKDMVVYGAALGEGYEMWMRSPEFLGDHSSKVIKRHETCFFQFVTDINNSGDGFSADGSQKLIVVDPAKLPYQNNRRNTKIFKLNPGLFFPWADRVIWQDAKLIVKYQLLPSDYILHFNRTVQRFGTCSSFTGLPLHSSAVGKLSQSVTLEAHCRTVIHAAQKRPSVSDDLSVLSKQCEKYNNITNISSQVFDQAPLVDSAFIVYDMRTEVCQKFNGDLGCSWLDEIHCYSDRDQIPFPHIVASGLKLSRKLHISGHEFRDRVYVNEKNAPMLHIAKRSCHWYYNSFSRCIAPEGEEIISSDEGVLPIRRIVTKTLRVAVVVAGTLDRFIFDSMLEHLIKPMIYEGVAVDYYATLTTAKAKAYRSGTGYTNNFQTDPTIPKSNVPDHSDIKEYLRDKIGSNFASIGALNIQESIDIDSEPMLKARRRKALRYNPEEDPDTRFPLFDIRTEEISIRTTNANRNLLRLHLAIQNLWKSALKWEAEEGFKYDYVILMRDDSLWLKDFNISKFVHEVGDIFIPQCDARDPPMDNNEVNDHILISRRDTAGLFGDYYSTLMETDVKQCMDTLPKRLTNNGLRGCNSEMLLKWVIEKQHVNTTKVGQGLFPFQRSANIRLPDGSNKQCFHKFCQSKGLPLILSGKNKGIKKCKNINWEEYFPPINIQEGEKN